MFRRKTPLCLAALLALAALLPGLRRALPPDRQTLIEAKYAGWSGVLRLWVCETWQPGSGSFSGWINRRAVAFEKRHPGVYVQPEAVDAETLAHWREGGMAPDLLLFPPGLLASPAGLLPLEDSDKPRAALRHLGDWAGVCCALPVAMGGYARLAAGEGPLLLEASDPLRPAAALALAAEAGQASETAATPPPAELDLGLTAMARRAALLPLASAWKAFAGGEGGALLATPRELRRLEALSARGQGRSWSLDGAAAFTDLVMFAGVCDGGSGEKQALCLDFAASLLEDDAQSELCRAGAFSVTKAVSGYDPGDELAAFEAALRGQALAAPPAFGTDWREEVSAILRKFDVGGDPVVLMEAIRAAL